MIKVRVFDLDLTLYALEARLLNELFRQGGLAALSEEAHRQKIILNKEITGQYLGAGPTWPGLERLARDKGMDVAALFRVYHEKTYDLAKDEIAKVLSPDLGQRLAALGSVNIMLSHGSQWWCQQMKKLLGLENVFDETLTFGADHPAINFGFKHESETPWLVVKAEAERIVPGVLPEEIEVIEDSISNLATPKRWGWSTALMANSQTFNANASPYVSHTFATIDAYVDAALQPVPTAKAEPAKPNIFKSFEALSYVYFQPKAA